MTHKSKSKEKKWEGPVYLTAEDLSQMLQVSVVLVYKLVREKRIPFYHVERCVRFDPFEVKDWLGERRMLALHMPRKLKRPPDGESSDKI